MSRSAAQLLLAWSLSLAAACGPPPVTEEPAPPPPPAPTPIPTPPPPRLNIHVEIAKNVALSGDFLYIATGAQELYMVDRRDPKLTLVMGQWCNSLASDGESVFASVESGIVKFSAGSKDPVRVTDFPAPLSMVVDDTHIYFNRFMKPGLFRVAKTGGRPDKLAAVKRVTYFGVDDTHIYFGNYGGKTIQRVAKSGGKVETVVRRAGRPIGVVVDDQYVYWGNESNSTVNRATKDGGQRTELARGQLNHDQLYADDTHVYWRAWRSGASDSVVARVAKNRPGDVEIVGGNLDGASGIALGDDTLFVAVKNSGRVVELRKQPRE